MGDKSRNSIQIYMTCLLKNLSSYHQSCLLAATLDFTPSILSGIVLLFRLAVFEYIMIMETTKLKTVDINIRENCAVSNHSNKGGKKTRVVATPGCFS